MERGLLALDTAGPRCSAALADGAGRLLARRDPEIGRGHAERLMDVVAEVLAEAGWSYRDIGRIVVTVGPGSFTGLRVGVAAARGLALSLDIPAIGVSTLEALAEPHWRDGSVLAVLDAKRGEVYAALYGRDGDVIRAPAAVPVAELKAFLDLRSPPSVIAGSGAALAAGLLDLGTVPRRDGEGHVDIAAVARLGHALPPGEPPRPLYLRGADAKPQGNASLRLAASG